MKKFIFEELMVFVRLVIANKNSAKLQKISECSYLESIELLNKIESMVYEGRKEKSKVELMSTVSYYTLDLEGKRYTIIDDNDAIEIQDSGAKEVPVETQNKIMRIFNDRSI